MPDQPEDPKKDAPKKDAPKPRTPEQDAKDALEGRKAVEEKKAAENKKLEDDGLVVAPGPITAYEHERAKLGVSEEAPEDKEKDAAKK